MNCEQLAGYRARTLEERTWLRSDVLKRLAAAEIHTVGDLLDATPRQLLAALAGDEPAQAEVDAELIRLAQNIVVF